MNTRTDHEQTVAYKDNPDFDEIEFMASLSQRQHPSPAQLNRCVNWYVAWLRDHAHELAAFGGTSE